MNYAVLWVPDFALHALRRAEPALAGKPVALIAGEGRKAVLTEVSPEASQVFWSRGALAADGGPDAARAPHPQLRQAAAALPVDSAHSPEMVGLTVTLAMARCPGIILRPRDPAAEVEAQRLLIAAAFTLSPRVESTAAGLCTIDLQGAEPARVEAAMRLQIAALTRAGLPVRAGAAATPLLAGYAARCAQPLLVVDDTAGFLRPLPLAFAEPTPAQQLVLNGWGLRTLGDLTALAKADVGQRLGTDGVALWERAAGEPTRPLRLTELPTTFVADWIYEPPVESMEPLLFKLRRYAERVAAELRAAGFVAEKLALTLRLEDETDYRREFRLPEPGADADSWLRVLLAHLESVRTAARITGVRLLATPARPQQKQDGLFDTGLRDPAAFWENLARLGAIVGDDRVGTPVMQDTHRPDAFALTRPVENVPPPAEPPVHPPRGAVLRRFRPAWPVRVMFADAQPREISGALRGAVRAARGPWRLDGEWWQPQPWAVETWHVELATGGVYQLACAGGEWCVEGVLD